ncbi:transmembrane protein adipocyte-associated 1 homolog [Octopus sinensis]|uniref:Transmembrane protein adipocyte-associated 1 homolog n=1 Tax=Octopus sinensis TaxID=2607531 RepID=A0A6P7SXW5_9MOLL|nr:transmembrane protein adipocyte-associated 1 homolog [Octopus sinensis]XP_029643013.1 transmembrane protein adipocyte-associated 1 homolog [Octopus sinensis]
MGDAKKFDSFNVHMMAKATATSHVFFSNSPLKYLDSTNATMTSTIVTTGAMTTLTTSTTDAHTTPNFEPFANTTFQEEPFCLQVLYKDIKERVRIWDLIILIPNVLFLIFLFFRSRNAIVKLRNKNSPIFLVFYALVVLVVGISILRCVVAMTVNASLEAGDDADKILWLILRFFLLTTELSLVIFGFAFGHLDSRTSIQRVLLVTSAIALCYSTTQGVLEFYPPKDTIFKHNNITQRDYDLFGHGGMEFWFTSSMFFFLVYTVITVLPHTNIRYKLFLPTKRSFYYYCALLSVLNCLQAIGSAMLYYEYISGLCIVDITTYLYFSFFDPLVYGTFLKELFETTSPSIPFSYRPQLDETGEDDTVNLPYHGSQVKVYADDTGSASGSYDSTHFDKQISMNPSINSTSVHIGNPVLQINSDYYQSYS